MDVLKFGHSLLWVAAGELAVLFVLSLVGIARRDRRCVLAARTGIYVVAVLVLGSSAALTWGFIEGAYNNEYIWGYSDKDLPFFFKVAGLWAGLDGSLLFWTLLLALASAIAAFQHRWSARHPSGRRMEPFVYLVLASVLGFFIAIVIEQNPFGAMESKDIAHRAWAYNIPIDHRGNLLNGKGLNPQLVNYWFVFHPPTLYLGMVVFTVPFAFGMAALMAGELGDYWIRITRRWAMVAWIFLTCGIILGGLWAYRQLGWGGYWAWDPVENASFLPWCAATAFLHSIMIQERRDMLKWWNVFLLVFTFFLTIEATYMTRSGEVDSVHAFAGGDTIGVWFRVFKWTIAGSGLLLLFLRFWDLRGSHQLESLLSREAAFFINNLVLVVLALSVWTLSWLPNLSSAYFGTKLKFEAADFNLFVLPLFILLLLLTAIGPGLGWVKSSPRSLRRNFSGAGLVALGLLGVAYATIAAVRPETISWKEVLVPKPLADVIWGKESKDVYFPAGLYPTGICLFLAFLIASTVGAEFLRGVKSRVRYRKEDVLTAFLRLVTRDNRRYGGYAVHIGIAVITVGIIVSSMFQIKEEMLVVRVGENARIGNYLIAPVAANRPRHEIDDAIRKLQARTHRVEDFEEGLAYLRDRVSFRIYHAPAEGGFRKASAAQEPVDGAPPATRTEPLPPDAHLLTELTAEMRFYPKQEQWIREVGIHRRIFEDVYLYFASRDAEERIYVTAFVNPFMMWIWAGWGIMILGGVFAIIPFSGNRVGLAE